MRERKSPRLKQFDYSTPGAYCITIATLHRRPVLAQPCGQTLQLTALGREVAECWRSLGIFKVNTTVDHFAIMPDHFHGIVFINLPWLKGYDSQNRINVCDVIRSFKLRTQTIASEMLGTGQGKDYFKLRQKRFYDTVIRDERHLYHARQYILFNELAWKIGKFGIPV